MKKIIFYILSLVIVIGCFCFVSTVAFAETSQKDSSIIKLVSNPLGEPVMNIEDVINRKATKAHMEERYDMFDDSMKPEKYSFDTSIYLFEYHVSVDYWDAVESLDYDGLTAAIDYRYPTIYIPYFGEVADTEGNIETRVFGHAKLSYGWLEKDYRLSTTQYNIADENYKAKKDVWFYEAIINYLSKNKAEAKQIFMIKYPSSLAEGHEMIAVIQTETDTTILDVSNTLCLEEKDGFYPATAYSISEYRTKRMELEKELYQTVDALENIQYGGNINPNQSNEDKTFIKFLPYIAVGVLGVGIVIVLSVVLYRKIHKSKQTE